MGATFLRKSKLIIIIGKKVDKLLDVSKWNFEVALQHLRDSSMEDLEQYKNCNNHFTAEIDNLSTSSTLEE